MSWAYTDTVGRTVHFDPCGDDLGAHIRVERPNVTICIPAHERPEAAQSMAGDGYRVVPNEGPTRGQVMEVLGVSSVEEIIPAIERLKSTANMPTWERELLAGQSAQEEIDDLRKQLHDAEAQAAQPDRPDLRERLTKTIAEVIHVLHGNAVDRVDPEADAVAIADVLVSGFDFVAQPDRPEPVDPASVRVGDIVDYETTVEYRMCRIMGEVEQTAEHVTGEDGRSLKIHGHWWNCNIATVRILQRPEPVPDEAAVEALRDAMVSTSDIVTDPESGDYSITDWARELIRSGVVEVVIPDE